jgi:hypothetical protein
MIEFLSRIIKAGSQIRELPLEQRLQKRGFRDVIQNLPQIENEIITDAQNLFLAKIVESQTEMAGNIFNVHGFKLKILTSFEPISRTLFLVLNPITQTNKLPKTHQRQINGFGLVRTVIVKTPEEVVGIADAALEHTKLHLQDEYRCLELFFRANFETLKQELFGNLSLMLNRECERQGKKELIGKIFFTVTVRNDLKFRYFFDPFVFNEATTRFIQQQSDKFSPVELMAAILLSEAEDTLNSRMEPGVGLFSSINSADYVSQYQDFRFWSSEAQLVNHKELTAFTIFKSDKLIFQLNCQKDLETFVGHIFTECQDKLGRRFSEGLGDYHNVIKAVQTIRQTKFHPAMKTTVTDLAGRFTGSTIAAIIKNMGK